MLISPLLLLPLATFGAAMGLSALEVRRTEKAGTDRETSVLARQSD
ncbi:MAG: hypothetical protein ACFB22_11010 [Rhodothalassiaceae bacterium]